MPDLHELPQDVQAEIVRLGRLYGAAGMLTMTDLTRIAVFAYQRGAEEERKACAKICQEAETLEGALAPISERPV